MVLFVERENKVVQKFTAGHGGIVAQNRIQKPCSVF